MKRIAEVLALYNTRCDPGHTLRVAQLTGLDGSHAGWSAAVVTASGEVCMDSSPRMTLLRAEGARPDAALAMLDAKCSDELARLPVCDADLDMRAGAVGARRTQSGPDALAIIRSRAKRTDCNGYAVVDETLLEVAKAVERLIQVAERVYAAEASENNGAVSGEASLCVMYFLSLEEALLNLGVTPYSP